MRKAFQSGQAGAIPARSVGKDKKGMIHMSMRKEWKFDITAEKLSAAAAAKVAHHQSRLEFWQKGRDGVMATIKESGLSIDESLGGSNYSKGGYGPQLVVDETYQRKLSEAHKKINFHAEKISEYTGWVEVLSANGGRSFPVNAEDYLYFFGK